MGIRRTRVTVVLRGLDFELQEDEQRPAYLAEWTHLEDFDSDEVGVTIRWGNDPYETFVPWASVLRIG